MFKNKYIKISVSAVLLLMALWVAVPKVYIHALLNHNHETVLPGAETKVSAQSANDDCDYEKYDKPVYFSIFQFISDFLPLKPQRSNKPAAKSFSISALSYAISLLRAPPVSK